MCITILSGKCLSVSQFLRRPKTSVLFAVRFAANERGFVSRSHSCSLQPLSLRERKVKPTGPNLVQYKAGQTQRLLCSKIEYNMSEEEDLAVLIYKSSKTAKARAAAAAVEEKGQINTSSTGRRTSTRKRSSSE